MKRISNLANSFIPGPPPYPSFIQGKIFSKFLMVVLLAGIALAGSSFQERNLLNGPQKQYVNESMSFKGKYNFSFEGSGVSGSGTGSHIGKFTLIEQNDLSGFPIITGTAIITAANGDQIFATHTGVVDLSNGTVVSEFIITGGTGNFTGATGGFESQGPVNLAQSTGSATFDGTICY